MRNDPSRPFHPTADMNVYLGNFATPATAKKLYDAATKSWKVVDMGPHEYAIRKVKPGTVAVLKVIGGGGAGALELFAIKSVRGKLKQYSLMETYPFTEEPWARRDATRMVKSEL